MNRTLRKGDVTQINDLNRFYVQVIQFYQFDRINHTISSSRIILSQWCRNAFYSMQTLILYVYSSCAAAFLATWFSRWTALKNSCLTRKKNRSTHFPFCSNVVSCVVGHLISIMREQITRSTHVKRN